MGTISKGSMLTRRSTQNYQCQTNGQDLKGFNVNKAYHTKLSMPNQWAQSQRVQCQPDVAHKTINVKSKDTISYLVR